MQAMEALVLAMSCMGDRLRALEVENARLIQERNQLSQELAKSREAKLPKLKAVEEK